MVLFVTIINFLLFDSVPMKMLNKYSTRISTIAHDLIIMQLN